MNKEALRAHYAKEVEWLEKRVLRALKDLLADVRNEFCRSFKDLGAPKYPECRVKDLAKVIEKLERQGTQWDHDLLFVAEEDGTVVAAVNDLVGGRLVCATHSDVEAVIRILDRFPKRIEIMKSEFVYQTETGYRAHHIDGRIEVPYAEKQFRFPVELQVKTLLQDAWANFGHDEFYKPSLELPEISLVVSRHLGDALFSLDMIGQAIRDEKFRGRRPPEVDPAETLITVRSLAYLVNEIFGESLSDVELGHSQAQLRAYGFDSVASVRELVTDPRVRNVVEVAKASARVPGKATAFEMSVFGPVAAKDGPEAVVREIRRRYQLIEFPCDHCGGPVSELDRDITEEKTDLDGKFLCQRCRAIALSPCKKCGLLTEAEICKTCRAGDEATQIV